MTTATEIAITTKATGNWNKNNNLLVLELDPIRVNNLLSSLNRRNGPVVKAGDSGVVGQALGVSNRKNPGCVKSQK